jgi:WD40 repeat protein
VGEDQITAFQWLQACPQGTSQLVVGTLMGHLHIFRVTGPTIQLVRFIGSAHFEAVTCLAECPLNSSEQCLFASGSYEGGLAVWSIGQKQAVFRMEASNRKVCSLLWDPGAKFILAVRDEHQDCGVLACFFGILKSDESVTLSDSVDLRLLKNTSNCVVPPSLRRPSPVPAALAAVSSTPTKAVFAS